jgi:hypothetical protein
MSTPPRDPGRRKKEEGGQESFGSVRSTRWRLLAALVRYLRDGRRKRVGDVMQGEDDGSRKSV